VAAYYNSQTEGELRKRIAEERQEARENLGDGCAADYTAYREQVGYLRALHDVEEWLAEIDTKLNQG